MAEPHSTPHPSYFLLLVSIRENLEKCRRLALAGFTSSYNGVWAYSDIQVGDYISFVYGARVFDLYEVKSKEAIESDTDNRPWPIIRFRSGLHYGFPFRLHLERVRAFEKSLVVDEFSYVAENLLLRGGYAKTHFQADETTLHFASGLGEAERYSGGYDFGAHSTFEPLFTKSRAAVESPKVFLFKEVILQSVIRRHLSSDGGLRAFLSAFSLDGDLETFEILSEKALPKGHVDILIKERNPRGTSIKVVIEVKSGKATKDDLEQVVGYGTELGTECKGVALVAKDFSSEVLNTAAVEGVLCFAYPLPSLDKIPLPFASIVGSFTLERRMDSQSTLAA